MQTCQYFKSRAYDWQGLSMQPTLGAKLRRSLQQFTPYRWTPFAWRPFRSPRRLLLTLLLPACILVCELNAFFLKARDGPGATAT